jgi:RNA polymerase-binding transcription factor
MSSAMSPARRHALKSALDARKRAVIASIRQDLREAAGGLANGCEVADSADTVFAMCEDDLRFALLPMKSEMLAHIDDALRRLEEGRYGRCRHCHRLIPERRLAAMPFAVRCRPCEEKREQGGRDAARRSHGVQDATSTVLTPGPAESA